MEKDYKSKQEYVEIWFCSADFDRFFGRSSTDILVGYSFLIQCKFLILILRKKNPQNEHIIVRFEHFFTCHYSKTVWLAGNLNEIKITHYEEIFSHIKQKFSHFKKGLGINNIFFVSMRLPLVSPRYITLKRNQKMISKTCNYIACPQFY